VSGIQKLLFGKQFWMPCTVYFVLRALGFAQYREL